ncbi:MAG: ATP synthase F1 subunit gamma [Peptostreptococcaceae bacterium]|nr:ATP synthase F1 subunit gamma [Peptostreptococcaceae bacterium]
MAGIGAQDIKRKIKSIKNTQQITQAMELVSTAKLKRSRDRLDKTKPYFDTIRKTIEDIFSKSKDLEHVYVTERDVKKTLYIVITADRGLCGGYNINAMKMVINLPIDKKEISLLAIGNKAKSFFGNREYEIMESYTGISEKPQYVDAIEIGNKAIELFESGEVDSVKLVYTQFVSTLSQTPKIVQLLPVPKGDEKDDADEEFIYVDYEPSHQVVLDYVIPKFVQSTIYGALVESSASEQGSRRVAMENATDNAEDMLESLTLSFNRARQAAITQEITEIVGATEALS